MHLIIGAVAALFMTTFSASVVYGQSSSPSGGTQVPTLVNVNLQNVLNDLSVQLHVDRANIPVNVQLPVDVAANVCGVSVAALGVSAGGVGNCTAKTGSPQLAQAVQQQMAAGGSVGGGAQGGNAVGTGSAAGMAGSGVGGASNTGGTSTGSGSSGSSPSPSASPSPTGSPKTSPTPSATGSPRTSPSPSATGSPRTSPSPSATASASASIGAKGTPPGKHLGWEKGKGNPHREGGTATSGEKAEDSSDKSRTGSSRDEDEGSAVKSGTPPSKSGGEEGSKLKSQARDREPKGDEMDESRKSGTSSGSTTEQSGSSTSESAPTPHPF